MKVEEIKDLFDHDLHGLGVRANSLNDDLGMFVINRHLNYSNICASKCPLCAYYRDKGDEDAYFMSKEEVMDKVDEAVNLGVTELHIVGSHNPDVTIEYFEDLFQGIKSKYPQVVLKALTATEINFLAKKEKMSVREVLDRLKASGLQVLPGGGAEILDDEIRKVICPNKDTSSEWLKTMRTAHKLGLKSNATMLFGHIEKAKHRAKHLYELRKLQEETGGFVSLIPLVFHPENTKLKEDKLVKERENPVEILKTIAVSRIVLDNFRSIRAYWVMLGEDLSQIALNYGANDIDGTLIEEKISHAAGARTPVNLQISRIQELIRGAGKVPVQRDTFCNILKVYS
ncbi:MAG: CofH family radical SAM protein [Archaeoglobaceae archaeon]